MGENSAIEWTDHTFNPWIGCTHVSPACNHCYAVALSKTRLGVKGGAGQPRRRTAPSTWAQPLAWDRRAARDGKRARVFCASLADVFDNEVPVEWRADLFALIRRTPNLDWLLLTKRIGNAAKMAEAVGGLPKNVWLGATVATQAEADRDVIKLLETAASKRFLSIEPLLEDIELYPVADRTYQMLSQWYGPDGFDETGSQPLQTRMRGYFPRLDWVIVGGESGPNARPMHPDWARSLRDQCATAGVPFLFKQWGEWAPGECATNTVNQRTVRTADWFDGAWAYETMHGNVELHADDEPTLFWAGKKAAGRLLDGITHDGMPTS